MQWLRPILLVVTIVLLSAGCTGLPVADDAAPGRAANGVQSAAGGVSPADATSTMEEQAAGRAHGLALGSQRTGDEMAVITFGDTIAVSGSGASVDGSVVKIVAGGTYRIGGTTRDGQILVDASDGKTVRLVLAGVDITCTASAPIYVKHAGATIIFLIDGTKNQISDRTPYTVADPVADEPDAAVFSKGDLTIGGSGSLTVKASYRHAIHSKGELSITGGNVRVDAAKDGVRGRDYVAIDNASVTVSAKGDGIRSSNDEDPQSGFVTIERGTVDVTAGEDGIEAETSVVVKGGAIAVSSGGGSAPANPNRRNQPDGNSGVSGKGIKAASSVEIEGGTIDVDSADDAINSNGNVTIDDGRIVLASGDDAIHADATLTVNGGDVKITRSYEGLEGAIVTVNDGSVHLTASDDGVNVAGGGDPGSGNESAGQGNAGPSVDKHLTIEGGYVVVDAMGDGFDVNGWAKMTGGTVIINGPRVSDMGALDYDREFTMVGGTLVAVGSTGMAQAPDATSTQSSLALSLGSPQPAGTLVRIEAEDGTALLTFAPTKEYQSVVFSSPELRKGSTYNVYVGGRSTGSAVDGVYSGGSYTPGTRCARPKITD